jgi:hypothetical protein
MPARHHVLAILAFWLATTGWLFYRDLRPRLIPGQPPPFTIDLADEARALAIHWTVFKDGKDRGRAATQVSFDERDGTFLVGGEYKLWPNTLRAGEPNQEVLSTYRVTPEGGLRAIHATIKFRLFGVEAVGDFDGQVQHRRLTSHVEARAAGFPRSYTRELPAVPVAERGSVLNPLQPFNRLPGLRKGQSWRMPLVNPVADALSTLVPQQAATTTFLDAEVLPQTQLLEPIRIPDRSPPNWWWASRQSPVPCLVIEYTGDDTSARTWVRESDGLVLRQEVTQKGDNLVLQRD